MEGNGNSVRAARRDTSSLASVSRAFLSVSRPITTSFCLGPQERTTGKVMHLTVLQTAELLLSVKRFK